MEIRINRSNPLRFGRLTICTSILSVFLVACGSDGVHTTETTVGTSGEPLSCQGSRMWGPIPLQEFTTYVSEANGRPEAGSCGIIWTFDARQNCRGLTAVSSEATTEVTASGDLIFQDPGLDSIRYDLPPANISVSTLEQLSECTNSESGTTSTGTDEGTTTADTTGGDTTGGGTDGSELTPLSCDGARVWGPNPNALGREELVYISEAGGTSNLHECAIFWFYIPSQNCVQASNIADDATARVTADGSLEFRFPHSSGVGDNLFEMDVADISFLALSQFPTCP